MPLAKARMWMRFANNSTLEKALAGKPWVKPKPVQDPPAEALPRAGVFPNPAPFPNLVPFPNQGVFPVPQLILPGIDPKMQEAMQKAQELMLKAVLIRGEIGRSNFAGLIASL